MKGSIMIRDFIVGKMMFSFKSALLVVILLQALIFLTIGYTITFTYYEGDYKLYIELIVIFFTFIIGVEIILITLKVTGDITIVNYFLFTPLLLFPGANISVSFLYLYLVLNKLFRAAYGTKECEEEGIIDKDIENILNTEFKPRVNEGISRNIDSDLNLQDIILTEEQHKKRRSRYILF